MRCHSLIFSIVVLMFAARSGADPAPTTQKAAAPKATVLVLPFAVHGDSKYEWFGKSLQQDLASGLSPNLRWPPVAASSANPAADAKQAIAAGRDAHATIVIFGQAQIIGKDARITGSVIEVPTSHALGNLSQAGSIDKLFASEDGVLKQALSSLPTEVLNLRGIAATRQNTATRVIQLPGAAPMPNYNTGPNDGGGTVIVPQPQVMPPGYATPYSPYAGSYPWRYQYPYGHLFTYDYDPDRFLLLPLNPGFQTWHEHPRPHQR